MGISDFSRGFNKTFDASAIGKAMVGRQEREAEAKKEAEELKIKLDAATKVGKALGNTDIPGGKIVGALMQEHALDVDSGATWLGKFSDKKSDVVAVMENLEGILGAFNTGDTSKLDKIIKDRDQEGVLNKSVGTERLAPEDGLTDMFSNVKPRVDVTLPGVKIKGQKQADEREQDVIQANVTAMGSQMAQFYKGKAATVNKSIENYHKIGSMIQDLSYYYSEGLKEGGVGSQPKKLLAKAKMWYGGDMAEELVQTGKLHGQKGEMAIMMMPIISGSVRIIKSVFNYLLESIPQGQEGRKQARGKLKQSGRSMYRITKAMAELGVTPEDIKVMSDEDAESIGSKLVGLARGYYVEPGGEEDLAIEGMTDEMTSALGGGDGKNEEDLSRFYK